MFSELAAKNQTMQGNIAMSLLSISSIFVLRKKLNIEPQPVQEIIRVTCFASVRILTE